jgi:hypothetical protein
MKQHLQNIPVLSRKKKKLFNDVVLITDETRCMKYTLVLTRKERRTRFNVM